MSPEFKPQHHQEKKEAKKRKKTIKGLVESHTRVKKASSTKYWGVLEFIMIDGGSLCICIKQPSSSSLI
jgi:hypothetical protein